MTWTLPQRMFLLSYDLDRSKLDSESVLVRGQLMRAAAVAQLTIDGLLVDDDGKAVRNTVEPPADAFLAEVLDHVSAKPRKWFALVDRHWHTSENTVRDQLAESGAITIHRSRTLGVFPTTQIILDNTAPVAALRETVRNVVLLGQDPTTVALPEVVLAVLAVEGDVCCVFTRKERREHKRTIAGLTEYVDEVLPGLRRALVLSMAARRAGAA
ncbi:GOLPH3/VPS74 family protein [Actinoalloteichus hymeniacidonis]|uniref:Phosphoprotein n=1 Tax=Actinoalloteichus hymeniacidonis TaxID=340345 RepID=A0AAC9HMF4_9PSEU|nr:GPP34 family phosphoprotein [Actinoalloteichus hymeniacidonis]AOS61930.1 putative phosphoprotein [Actinoalloteichus hymeniacidonis]MBB5910050.1 hypothetical protein [Actinoalloteichus hymeniacidonis]